MEYSDNFDKFCKALRTNGAFLVVSDDKQRTNIMTIGWAQIGVIWGKPVMTVLSGRRVIRMGSWKKPGISRSVSRPKAVCARSSLFAGPNPAETTIKSRNAGSL